MTSRSDTINLIVASINTLYHQISTLMVIPEHRDITSGNRNKMVPNLNMLVPNMEMAYLNPQEIKTIQAIKNLQPKVYNMKFNLRAITQKTNIITLTTSGKCSVIHDYFHHHIL